MNSKAKGERSEGIILGHLMRLGMVVLMPFGNNQRYDMVIDEGGDLVRAQCKTATFKNGCVQFWSCSTNGFTGEKKGYRGQVDVFLVYCPKLDKIYRVPVNDVGERAAWLRVDDPKGGPTSTIRWARDYEI